MQTDTKQRQGGFTKGVEFTPRATGCCGEADTENIASCCGESVAIQSVDAAQAGCCGEPGTGGSESGGCCGEPALPADQDSAEPEGCCG